MAEAFELGPPRSQTSPLATLDLHCHLLPGLDDGALDLADSIAMAQQAQRNGIEAICATPHIRHDHDVRIHELARRRKEGGELEKAGCMTRVLAGAEVAVSALLGLTDDELRLLSLGGGGRWILLEPLPGPLYDRLDAAVGELAARGFRALIAHPERHLTPDIVDRLHGLVVTHGALIQATAAYFCEARTRDGMLELAGHGVVHVLGSDAHSSQGGRPVELAAGLEALRSVARTAPHLDWIASVAPAGIVRGADLTPPF